MFVAVATPLMHFLGDQVDDNGLIILAAKASVLLPIPLVVAAVLSQFSAAVADTLGAAGNVVETSHKRVHDEVAYFAICSGAIILTWSADTLQILALASRAFAFYYLLQCLVTLRVSVSPAQRVGVGLLAGVLAFIAIFAVPAG